MNIVIQMGRLTKDPVIRQAGEMPIAHYSIAVDRRIKREGQQDTDFFNCVAFGKNADFVEKYLKKGIKIIVKGRLQQNPYTDKDGNKVNAVEIVAEEHEFCESKGSSAPVEQAQGFVPIPDDLEELPFA